MSRLCVNTWSLTLCKLFYLYWDTQILTLSSRSSLSDDWVVETKLNACIPFMISSTSCCLSVVGHNFGREISVLFAQGSQRGSLRLSVSFWAIPVYDKSYWMIRSMAHSTRCFHHYKIVEVSASVETTTHRTNLVFSRLCW